MKRIVKSYLMIGLIGLVTVVCFVLIMTLWDANAYEKYETQPYVIPHNITYQLSEEDFNEMVKLWLKEKRLLVPGAEVSSQVMDYSYSRRHKSEFMNIKVVNPTKCQQVCK